MAITAIPWLNRAEEFPMLQTETDRDLKEAALAIQDSIRRAYRQHERDKPLVLFDIQEQRLYVYPYDFKDGMSARSRALLEEQYAEAQARNQIVVLVRDNGSRRMISFSLDYE